jgi:RHS repeat-associated protein
MSPRIRVADRRRRALARRIGVKDSGTQTWTVYDGLNPYADFNGSGTLLTRYASGPALDELLARTSSGGTTAWYLTDKLGSVRDVANTSGTVIDHVVYDSYGNITSESSPANGDRFKFTGMEFDAAIGQYYDHARFYSSVNGRFTQQDPLGFESGGMNGYRYIANAPTNGKDPSGSQALVVPGMGGFPNPDSPQWRIPKLLFPNRPPGSQVGWPRIAGRKPDLRYDWQMEWYKRYGKRWRAYMRAYRAYQAWEDANMWRTMEAQRQKIQDEIDEGARQAAEQQGEMIKTLLEVQKQMYEQAMHWIQQAMSGHHLTPYVPPPEQGPGAQVGPGAVGIDGGQGAAGGQAVGGQNEPR